MFNRKTAWLVIAGGAAGLLAWLISEPFIYTVPKNHLFTVGSFYGWFAHLLYGFLAGSFLSLTISKHRTEWGRAVLAGLLGGGMAAISVSLLDAISDLTWIQITQSNWMAQGESVVPSFFWNLAIAFALSVSVALATQPTPARLKRALMAAGAAGIIAFFLRLAAAPLVGIVELWNVNPQDLLEGKVKLARWIAYSPSRLLDLMGLGIVVGLVLGVGETMMRRAWMRVMLATNETRDYIIEDGPNRIGSAEGIEVPLFGDASILPVHAIVKRETGSFYVTDMGAGKPTLLNGQPVRQAPISDGDELRIGRYAMQFRLSPTHEYYDPQRPFGYVPVDDPSPVKLEHRMIDPFSNIISLPLGVSTIGSAPNSTVSLPYDSKVAPTHAKIEADVLRATITDLGGSGGTLVNGKPISGRTDLADHDTITVGGTKLTYRC